MPCGFLKRSKQTTDLSDAFTAMTLPAFATNSTGDVVCMSNTLRAQLAMGQDDKLPRIDALFANQIDSDEFNAFVTSKQLKVPTTSRFGSAFQLEIQNGDVIIEQVFRVSCDDDGQVFLFIGDELAAAERSMFGAAEFVFDTMMCPFNTLKTIIPLLVGGEVTNKIKLASTAGRALKALGASMLDLIKIADIATGNLPLDSEWINWRRGGVFSTVRSLVQSHFDRRSISLRVDETAAEEFDDQEIFIDLGLITKALTTLLVNAAKHTPEDGLVTVNVNETSESENTVKVCVTVRDGGSGMTPEARAALSHMLEAPQHALRQRGASLTLVHMIARRHNGALQLSPDGKSMDFVFVVPCRATTAASAGAGSSKLDIEVEHTQHISEEVMRCIRQEVDRMSVHGEFEDHMSVATKAVTDATGIDVMYVDPVPAMRELARNVLPGFFLKSHGRPLNLWTNRDVIFDVQGTILVVSSAVKNWVEAVAEFSANGTACFVLPAANGDVEHIDELCKTAGGKGAIVDLFNFEAFRALTADFISVEAKVMPPRPTPLSSVSRRTISQRPLQLKVSESK
jgi:signal transduction histidine kinase